MNITKIMRWAIITLVIVVAVWTIYLLFVGIFWSTVLKVQLGEPLSPVRFVYRPYRSAIFTLLALLPVAIAMLREAWTSWAWASVVLLLLVGNSLVFSIGLVLMVAAGALAVLLSIVHWQRNGQPHWLLAGWVGIGLLLHLALLYAYAPVYKYVGASAILLALLIVTLHGRGPDFH